jgi:Response regulator containing CheY-like receiver, AAA-type ATPase, and DNA-binding domains
MPHLRGSTTGENTCEFMSLENFSDAKREFETQFLSDKLKKSQWNISATADKLGMRQPNLSRKIKELRISRTN